ncbi:hypothetical protein [Streptomyces sp. NPDC091278]|uniref:hypothetical protein n=1 Tax=Streptomyces sp. NPDC091278 TaxID=3155301 RepID=UPI00344E2359
MRERAGASMGNPLSCGVAGPVLLLVAYAVRKDDAGPDRLLPAGAVGAVVTAAIPVAALGSARRAFPAISGRHRAADGDGPYGEETLVAEVERDGVRLP